MRRASKRDGGASRIGSRGDHEYRLAATLLSFAFAVALWTSAAVPGPIAASVCHEPSEAASAHGWTTRVDCGRGHSPPAAIRGPARLLFGQSLDLNRADPAALEVLPHIGPRRAAAIVETRARARFVSVRDLARVPGIGPRTIEALGEQVSVEVSQ